MKKDFQWRLERGCEWFWEPTVGENNKMSPTIYELDWISQTELMSLSLFLLQVNEIYQDHSLGANINVVLVKIIILSPTKVLNWDTEHCKVL